MAKPYLIGVDLGTAGTKAGLFDVEGKLLAQASEESRLIYPGPGWVEQDPEDIYGSALRTIRKCLERSRVNPSDVAALAFDGQMSGLGTVDEAWGTPTVYDSWLDTRCGAYIPRLKAREDRIIALTGGFPTLSHGAKILWWKHERPEVYRRVAKFVVPGGYVAGRMAGLRGDQAFIDPTYLHFSCFSQTVDGAWAADLTSFFDVEPEKLPRIVDSTEIIGRVTAPAAAATGLLAGTPIAAGCGDQAAGMLGAGMVRPGLVFDVAGTASVFSVCLDSFATDREHRTLFTARLPLPGLYYALAYINGGGLNLRWFRDQFAAAEQAAGGGTYHALDLAAADLPPGAGGLLFLPHLGGRVCPSDADMRGMFVGLNWAHTRAHLYRAMLEAVAYEYAFYLSIVRGLLPDLA
ncbi:MAG: FGGY-family carbohydrate kinase, partial [Anaerolineales bacterium]